MIVLIYSNALTQTYTVRRQHIFLSFSLVICQYYLRNKTAQTDLIDCFQYSCDYHPQTDLIAFTAHVIITIISNCVVSNISCDDEKNGCDKIIAT
jgi:hypothetical protein